MKKGYVLLAILTLITVMCTGCSKNDNVDTVSDIAEKTSEETVVYLEYMKKFNYEYDPVEKDTAVIAGIFVINTTEIKIEFLNLSDGEQIVATLYSKNNEDKIDTVIDTATAISEKTDLKFTNLTSETEYTLELKNTGIEEVDIECLISQ